MNPLDELFWRDEILQTLFWMRGEGLADGAGPAELARFLAADRSLVEEVLSSMAAGGYVAIESGPASSSPAYRLTPLGIEEGGRRFRDEFAALTRQAHGECGPGCWCHDPEREGEPCPNLPTAEPDRAPV